MNHATEKMATRREKRPVHSAVRLTASSILAALLGLGFSTSARAQSIWSNPITNGNPSATNPFTSGDIFDPNITVSGVGAGSGVTANAGSNRFNFSGWSQSGLDNNDYFSWT